MRRTVLGCLVGLGLVGQVVVACSDSETRSVQATDAGVLPSNGNDGAVGANDGGTGNVPTVEFIGDKAVQGGTVVSASRTLTKDKTWGMKGVVYVPSGVTLTIEAGTTIKGDKATLATLVIQPGGKINAVGTADQPIVFTSMAKEGQRQPGDWGGVILLGKAPVNGGKAMDGGISQDAYIEGLVVTPENRYGGAEVADSSGTMQYVRIEYSGVKIGADNEINGLTFGGVGSGTKVDHIMVRHTLDDCFEFFGGTVSADHLVCAYNQDDGFDWDNGFAGNLQFLVLQQDPKFDDEMNGFEGDNDALGLDSAPISNPTIYNVTLCGQNASGGAKRKFGMLLRRQTAATIRNTLVWGFDAAMDIRDANTHKRAKGEITPSLTVQNSQFFGFTGPNLVDGLALTPDPAKAAEVAFGPESAWLKTAGFNNVVDVDPKMDCQNPEAPNFVPTTVITDKAATPPTGMDTTAKFVGAFKDAGDKWATTGKWVAWTKVGF